MLLAVFNLIPIHPLDGGQIFGGFLDKMNPDLSEDELYRTEPSKVMYKLLLGRSQPSSCENENPNRINIKVEKSLFLVKYVASPLTN